MYAVYPAEVSAELARFLDLGGYDWKPVSVPSDVTQSAPGDGWAGAILQVGRSAAAGGAGHGDAAGAGAGGAGAAGAGGGGAGAGDGGTAGVSASGDDSSGETVWAVARALREHASAALGVLVLVRGNALDELTMRDELFDDFCLDPFHPRELEARLTHLGAATVGSTAEIIVYGPLRINLHTYEAVVDERPLDLTYMEYELLRFLASQPGRVFTREALLGQVWRYGYYGGERTVDVHIRRLRAKLGEENAGLIQTVRSVGYRLGTYRWR